MAHLSVCTFICTSDDVMSTRITTLLFYPSANQSNFNLHPCLPSPAVCKKLSLNHFILFVIYDQFHGYIITQYIMNCFKLFLIFGRQNETSSYSSSNKLAPNFKKFASDRRTERKPRNKSLWLWQLITCWLDKPLLSWQDNGTITAYCVAIGPTSMLGCGRWHPMRC